MPDDQLIWGFMLFLIVLMVILVCNPKKEKCDEKFQPKYSIVDKVIIPKYWLRPRTWYDVPYSFENMYSEEALACMDRCPEGKYMQDCLQACRAVHPMGIDERII